MTELTPESIAVAITKLLSENDRVYLERERDELLLTRAYVEGPLLVLETINCGEATLLAALPTDIRARLRCIKNPPPPKDHGWDGGSVGGGESNIDDDCPF